MLNTSAHERRAAGLRRARLLVGLASLALPFAALGVDLDKNIAFNISAQDLSTALIEFSRQARLQVIVSDDLSGQTTQGVSGQKTIKQALSQLLGPAGLRYRVAGETSITVVKAIATDTTGVARPSPVIRIAQAEEGAERTPERLKGEDPERVEEIVVTGSHIRGSEAASPVLMFDREYIDRSGYQTAGAIIRDLPQSFAGGLNVGVVGAGGSQNTQSQSGASTANLRGLGSESTLTLVNGHRLAYAEAASAVDVSMIPIAAIERVDVVTDGASAIYGSEAVGGVVNFILRKDFEGIRVGGAWGAASDGGGTLQRYELLTGQQWRTGQALISYEFARQNRIDSADRSYVSPTIAGTTLLPDSRRNSLFISASQSITPTVDIDVQGLYTKRDADSLQNLGPFVPGLLFRRDAQTEQYGVAATGSILLSETWRAALSADASANDIEAPAFGTVNGIPDPANSNGGTFHTHLRSLEIKADGELFSLPSGAARLAGGLGYREETFSTASLPPTTPPVSAVRQIRYAFAEALVPLVARSASRVGLNALELSLAARYEDYSDFGSSTNPKVGLIYAPSGALQLKASWGRSFRAPALLQEHNPSSVYLFSITDPSSPGGTSLSLLRFGGNPQLSAEESDAYAIEAALTPSSIPGARVQLSVYEIDYKDRIGFPFQNSFAALSDPFGALFVTRDPSAAAQAAIIGGTTFFNFSGVPYDPGAVASIVDNRYQNASSQRASGLDLLTTYQLTSAIGEFDWSLNLAYLKLRQRITTASPLQTLTGTVFNPPKLRGRFGMTYKRGRWGASAFANHAGSSSDPASLPPQAVASWTTIDARLSYDPPANPLLGSVRVALSAQNLLNRRPPFVSASQSGLPGINFDATNASPVGRFLTLEISTTW